MADGIHTKVFDWYYFFYEYYILSTRLNIQANENKIEESVEEWIVCHLKQYVFGTGIRKFEFVNYVYRKKIWSAQKFHHFDQANLLYWL